MQTSKTPRELMLEEQLRKRNRFDWLVLAFGVILGCLLMLVVSMPPVWLGAL